MTCCNDKPTSIPYVVPYAGFTEFTTSIPKLFWNVKSQEQRILAICEQINKIICYADILGDKVNLNRADIDELQRLFNEFMESGFDDYYEEQIHAWVVENMPDIVGDAMRMVFFGCTEDGHFTAYIPDSWKPVIFNYGANYADKNTYGHIILEMYVTDTFQVNGKPTDLIWEVQ